MCSSGDAECLSCFFFADTATTEIYTLSLHDALPIFRRSGGRGRGGDVSNFRARVRPRRGRPAIRPARSEEHTSELQSHHDLVCRLLLEKKKKSIRRLATFGQSAARNRSPPPSY